MKTICNFFYLLCFCLVASRDHVLGKKFDVYSEAKKYYEGKNYFREGRLPFVRDGDKNPPNKAKFHDVMGTLFLSEFTYGIGKLRKETKAHAFEKPELVKELGCSSSMADLLIGDKKFNTDPIKIKDVEDVLENGEKIFEKSNKRFANELMVTAMKAFEGENKVYIYQFDAKYNHRNLVYCIAGRTRSKEELGNEENSSKEERDLFLSFRGSATSRDWKQNFQTKLVDIALRKEKKKDNKLGRHRCYMIEPLTFQRVEITEDLYNEFMKIVDESGEPIRIHSGFLGYLFADRGEDAPVGPQGLGKSMFTNMREGLLQVLGDNSKTTNNLYVTGHSLGGALAHTAAFFLASDSGINERGASWEGVKCITFAAPSSGNISFQRAFEVLAKKNAYQSKDVKDKSIFRNIRIVNSRDPVPLFVPWSRYRQTPGVRARLGRRYWIRLGNVGAPWIKRFNARWNNWWGGPTSFYGGFFGPWIAFLWYVTITVPVLLIVFQLLLRPIYAVLPLLIPIKGYRRIDHLELMHTAGLKVLRDKQFKDKWADVLKEARAAGKPLAIMNGASPIKWDPKDFAVVMMRLTKEWKKKEERELIPIRLVGSLNLLQEYNKWDWGNWGVWQSKFGRFLLSPKWNWWVYGSLMSILFFVVMLIPNLPLFWRFVVLFGAFPGLVAYLIRNISDVAYMWCGDHLATGFIAGCLALQILALILRAPWDVFTVKVHLLTNHFDNLRPHHHLLSSSDVLVDKYLPELK